MDKFTLCADDFGLSKSVNEGIITLVEKGRLNAVSCMSMSEHFADAIHLIKVAKSAPHPVEFGLHITLTEYEPLTKIPTLAPEYILPSIGKLILKSYLGQLNLTEVSNEIRQQVTQFQETFGHAPHFIDGHQHAHILPGIRDIILKYGNEDCWVRQCTAPLSSVLKMRTALPRTLLISALSQKLARTLHTNAIPQHAQFFGINNFDTTEDFAKLMDKWLYHIAKLDKKSLIMCHPGLETEPDEPTIHDPIRNRRPQEYKYLASDQFPMDMNKYGLSL